MRECQFSQQIDDYLLGRLSQEDRDRFEEHYFNCRRCFEEMTARDELLAVVKERGQELMASLEGRKDARASKDKAFAFLSPKVWTFSTLAAVVVLAVVLIVLPRGKDTPLEFVLNGEDVVRGESINLLSPVIDIDAVPDYFEWKALGTDAHYKIYIFNSTLLWSGETDEEQIDLPEEVKALMTEGETYSWQVKAFSPQGQLTAVSSKVRFKIKKDD